MTNPTLTTQEENLIKDILKTIGNNPAANRRYAQTCGLSEVEFDSVADSIFRKLGNGRVTLVEVNNRDIGETS